MDDSSVPQDVVFFHGAFVHYITPSETSAHPQDQSRSSASLRKLAGFSDKHLIELSADMYDEMQRRLDPQRVATGPLRPRKDIHWKRNDARKHVGSLPNSRFHEICRDLITEQERRYSGLTTGPVYPLQDAKPMRDFKARSSLYNSEDYQGSHIYGRPQLNISTDQVTIQSVNESNITPTKVQIVESDSEYESEDDYEDGSSAGLPVRKSMFVDVLDPTESQESIVPSENSADKSSDQSDDNDKAARAGQEFGTNSPNNFNMDEEPSRSEQEGKKSLQFDETSGKASGVTPADVVPLEIPSKTQTAKDVEPNQGHINEVPNEAFEHAPEFNYSHNPEYTPDVKPETEKKATLEKSSKRGSQHSSGNMSENSSDYDVDYNAEYKSDTNPKQQRKNLNITSNDSKADEAGTLTSGNSTMLEVTENGRPETQSTPQTSPSRQKQEIYPISPPNSSGSQTDKDKTPHIIESREYYEMKAKLEEQHLITERVRRDAARFLDEMRALTQKHEQESSRADSLDAEVAFWKKRYSKVSEELEKTRLLKIDTAIETPVIPESLPDYLTSSEGKIEDRDFHKATSAISLLVSAVHNNMRSQNILDTLHRVVLATRDISKEDKLIIRAVKQLISVVRNYTVSKGVFPRILVDSASSDMIMAIMEYAKSVKVKKSMESTQISHSPSFSPLQTTASTLKESPLTPHSEYSEQDREQSQDQKSKSNIEQKKVSVPMMSETDEQSINTTRHGSEDSSQNESQDGPRMKDNTPDTKHRSMKDYNQDSANSELYRTRKEGEEAKVKGKEAILSRESSINEPTRSSQSSGGLEEVNQKNLTETLTVKDQPLKRESLEQTTEDSSLDKKSHNNVPHEEVLHTKHSDQAPAVGSEGTLKEQMQPLEASERRAFLPKQGPEIPLDESIQYLQTYLEEQTSGTVEAIGSLLAGIKSNVSAGELKTLVVEIQTLVGEMIEATDKTLVMTRSRVLKDKGSFILRNLRDCLARMDMLRTEELESIRTDAKPNRHLKQRLAGVNFDMAKSTKELVKTVEEVVLQYEVAHIDRRLV